MRKDDFSGNTPEPEQIVNMMMKEDRFTKYMAMEIGEVKPGFCRVSMKIGEEMLNGFGICHGGVIFSLADSALAFAANTRGRVSVTLDMTASFIGKVDPGEILEAVAEELNLTNGTGVYDVSVANSSGKKIALFRGTVYRTRDWK